MIRHMSLIRNTQTALQGLLNLAKLHTTLDTNSIFTKIRKALREIVLQLRKDIILVVGDIDKYIAVYNQVQRRKGETAVQEVKGFLKALSHFTVQMFSEDRDYYINNGDGKLPINSEDNDNDGFLTISTDISNLLDATNRFSWNLTGAVNEPTEKLEALQEKVEAIGEQTLWFLQHMRDYNEDLLDFHNNGNLHTGSSSFIPRRLNGQQFIRKDCGVFQNNILNLIPHLINITRDMTTNGSPVSMEGVELYLWQYHTLEAHVQAIDKCQVEYIETLSEIQKWKNNALKEEEELTSRFTNVEFNLESDSKSLVWLKQELSILKKNLESDLRWRLDFAGNYFILDTTITPEFYQSVTVNLTDIIKSDVAKFKNFVTTAYNSLLGHAANLEPYFIDINSKEPNAILVKVGKISLWKRPYVVLDEPESLKRRYSENRVWPRGIDLAVLVDPARPDNFGWQAIQYTTVPLFQTISSTIEGFVNDLVAERDDVQASLIELAKEMEKVQLESSLTDKDIL